METDLTDLTALIRAAFPEGFDEATGTLVYSALCGGEVVLEDGRRLHASWRGTGDCVAQARGAGDYLDYYCGFRTHDDPEVAPVRERLLRVPGVSHIEAFPRDETPPYYPQEQTSAAHPSGWDLFEIFTLAPEPPAPLGDRSRLSPLAERLS